MLQLGIVSTSGCPFSRAFAACSEHQIQPRVSSWQFAMAQGWATKGSRGQRSSHGDEGVSAPWLLRAGLRATPTHPIRRHDPGDDKNRHLGLAVIQQIRNTVTIIIEA